jgi:hypothetical protein
VIDSSKTYRVNVPKDVPMDDFWELIGYSIQTRSYIDTPANRIAVSSKNAGLQKNEDGTVDVYVGRERLPARNPIGSRPSRARAFFLPSASTGRRRPFYDRKWTPSNVEKINL